MSDDSTPKPNALTNAERETILARQDSSERASTLRCDGEERVWHVFSEIPKDVRHFAKLFGPGSPYGQHDGMMWEVPVDQLRINKKRSVELSPEQKAALAERFAKARAGTKPPTSS